MLEDVRYQQLRGLAWALLGIVLGGFWAPAAAQQAPATLAGQVVDAETQEPLVGVAVAVRGATAALITGSVTGLDGTYRVDHLPPGTYSIEVRFIGYEIVERAVELAAGQAATLDVGLLPTDLLLNPIVVTASRRQEKALDAPASVSALGSEEFARSAAASPVAALRYTPGVDIAQAGADRYLVTMRGFNALFVPKSYTLVDYRQVAAPALGSVSYALLPTSPLDLQQVEVVRGPGSALYGAGVEQGVIHFITKDPLAFPGTSAFVAGGEQAFFQGSARHAGRISDRLGYKVVGYYSRNTDWPLDPSNAEDAAIIDAIAPQRLDETGAPVGPLAGREEDNYKGYLAGTLQLRFGAARSLTTTTGYGALQQVFQTSGGDNQAEDFAYAYGQARLRWDGLFAQLYVNATDAGDSYLYRTGAPIVDRSLQFAGQVQHGWSLADDRVEGVVGADVERVVPRTEGTVNGRNEDVDALTEVGAYAQVEVDVAPWLDVVAAGRLDRDDVLQNAQFSPRLGAVGKLSPAQTVRATFNRAFSSPLVSNLFLDVVTVAPGVLGPFGVRARGTTEGWTFGDGPQVSSFLPGVGRYQGAGVPLSSAYQVVVQQLADAGRVPAELAALLQSRADAIGGFSGGVLGFVDGDQVRLVSGVDDLPTLKQTVDNTLEIGYKGLFADRLSASVDVYYTRKTNFLSEALTITPLVLVPQLGRDLANAVAGAFTAEDLAAFGLTPQDLAALFQEAGATLAEGPLGVVEPEENYDPSTAPEVLLTFVNFGEVDYYGTDLALEYVPGTNVTLFGNYSWVSDNEFSAEELGEADTGLEVTMAAPQHRLRLGGSYTLGNLRLEAATRYASAFRVNQGVYQGEIDASFQVDAGVGYDLASVASGLRFDVEAINLLNEEHRPFVGAPEVGRLLMARLTYGL